MPLNRCNPSMTHEQPLTSGSREQGRVRRGMERDSGIFENTELEQVKDCFLSYLLALTTEMTLWVIDQVE